MMKSHYRWITIIALVLLIGGTFLTISAQTSAGRDIWLPLITGGAQTTAEPTEPTTPAGTPLPTTPAGTPLPTTPAGTPLPIVVPPADAASARLTVPEGFAVRIFAQGTEQVGDQKNVLINGPRLMAIGPDGALYVAERASKKDEGRVLRLPDADDDGLADKTEEFLTGLNGPHSVEWYKGALYIAENDKVTKWENGKTTEIVKLPEGGGHSSRTARIGPDGFLYVAAGSTCNVCVESDKRRATIMRYTLDGKIPADNPFAKDSDASRRPVWAEGLRNSVDFLWMPDGQLWVNMNSSDGLGDDVPPEPAVINVTKGTHYGWPFCYTKELGAVPPGAKQARDSRIPFAGPISSCDQPAPALFTDAAHQAPLGMTRYDGTQFPATYQGSLFEAYHGSWNTDNVANYRDCKVQFVSVQGGTPVASETFLGGFRKAGQKCGDGDKGAWGRPAGVVAGPNGELFVSDDKNGNIYRVVYVGS